MGDCKIDIGKLIIEKLEAKDRTIAWLARKIGRNGSNLHKTLKNSKYIHANLLFDISIVLENDFFAYYSQELKELNDENGKIH